MDDMRLAGDTADSSTHAVAVRPDETGVRAAMQSLAMAMEARGYGAECRSTVEIAATEALNNVVEHAFATGSPAAQGPAIRLRGHLRAHEAVLRIIDNGAALPGGNLPEGAAQDLDVATGALPEGGFGWFLIRSLAREIGYRRIGGCNVLTLTFDVARSEAP
jgi:serine/threonine-protein kinase RsbW